MKIEEITVEDVASHLRLDFNEEIEKELKPIMQAAKGYILSIAGISEEKLNEYGEFYIAFMVLCEDMYDNRSYIDQKGSYSNKVVDSILFMHSNNLVR